MILKGLLKKKIIISENQKVTVTKGGNDTIEKTINRINEKIIKIFKKTDPKNMAGFINIIESI